MSGLDEWIAGLGADGSLVVVLVVALLLGLRHAADPDHLVAVSTLVASEGERPVRRATALGLAWGAGHGATLALFGLPIVLWNGYLPPRLQAAAEALVGLVIVAFAVKLLHVWRAGAFHVHVHEHDGHVHRHLHRHRESPEHEHEHRVLRAPSQAFGLGLVHGIGGSAGVALLLLASIEDQSVAVVALLLFAVATAASMAALSSGLGYALGRRRIRARMQPAVPALALLSAVFGVWYALAALA